MSSIQRTLALVLLLGFGLLLGLGGGLIYFLVQDALIERFDAKLRVEALTIITYTEQEHDKVDVDFTDRYIREFDDEVATQFFQVWHPKGKTIERSDSLEDADLPRPAQFGTLDRPRYLDLQLDDGRDLRAIALGFVPHSANREGRHYNPGLNVELVVAALRGELDQTLAALRVRFFGAGAVAVAGALALVLFALRRGLAPLRQVADQAAGIDASTLRTRIPTEGLPVELVPICERLNELLARLEASFERERRFSADVAHELRTPIAELRSLSEVALKWPPDAVDSQQGYEETLSIACRMEALVNALQTIARSESGNTSVNSVLIRLPAFLHQAWESFAPVAQKRGLQVEFDLSHGSRVFSDPVLLTAAVSNLFANAVEYTPSGGTIRVLTTESAGRVTLEVRNAVNNLQPGDVARLFDRFWRKDSSRTDARHSGLGLSLVRAITRTLAAEVSAELLDASTLAVRIDGLPGRMTDDESPDPPNPAA